MIRLITDFSNYDYKFFNIYKPRKYDYHYIYYDPLKEARKERERRMGVTNEDSDKEYRPTLHRGSFREEADKLKNTYKEVRKTNRNVLIILIILLILAYFLLR